MPEVAEMLERPRSEALDAILGKPFKVLNDGFVRVVDYMGSDQSVVQAARVSYGDGTKQVSEDRGLIRYLLRHRHTTPFEMAEIKLHVRVPMDCWRQWIRHRTACLAGDSLLYFDLPGADQRGGRQRHNVTMEKFFRMWHDGTAHPMSKKKPAFAERIDPNRRYSVKELASLVERRPESVRNLIRAGRLRAHRLETNSPNQATWHIQGEDWLAYMEDVVMARVSMRERLSQMQLRMCNEDTGEIQHTQVVDIWQSGIKPVFRVTLANGYAVKMSRDHRCLTEKGWMTLDQATRLRLSDQGKVTWDATAPTFAVNGIPCYQDRDWLSSCRSEGLSVDQMAGRAGVSYHTIRKYLKQFGLQFSTAEKAQLSAQGQRGRRRQGAERGPLSGDALKNVQEARSGANSNFWKGGVTPERANIGRWTREQSPRVHARHGWRCVLCQQGGKLHAHHLDPVWHNPDGARVLENLISLCHTCHQLVHAANLELKLLDAVQQGQTLDTFWRLTGREPRHPQKRKPSIRRLVRTFSPIANIEYVGDEMTYDLEVSGPFHNFVANGFVVHNSINEYSTRYSVAIDAAQTTQPHEWRLQSADNKQGSAGFLGVEAGRLMTEQETQIQRLAREVYEERLALGVAREQARKDLPLATYTEAYWKTDLHNLLHFLALRMDPHAQYEIRAYSEVIGHEIVRHWCPMAWEAFMDYRFGGLNLTKLDAEILAAIGKGDHTGAVAIAEGFGLLNRGDDGQLKRNRERAELEEKLQRFNLPIPW